MTQDNANAQPGKPGAEGQKTVAELLAQHGGANQKRRRHRRAAPDSPEPGAELVETAPQAIIDRISGEGKSAGSRRGRKTAGEQPQASGHFRTPESPAPAPSPEPPGPRPRPQISGPMRRPQVTEQAKPAADSPAAAAPARPANSGHYPRPSPQASGAFPLAEPAAPAGGQVRRPRNAPPPAAPPGREARPSAQYPLPAAPEGRERAEGGSASAAPGVPSNVPPPHPPAPGASSAQLPIPGRTPWPGGNPGKAEPHTEEFAAVRDAPPERFPGEPMDPHEPPAGLADWRGTNHREDTAHRADRADTEATEVGGIPPVPDDPGEELPDTGYYDNLAEDVREQDEEDPADSAVDPDADHDSGLDDDDLEDTDDDPDRDEAADEAETEPAPAKQWAYLAVQLVGGVAGGAATWLGFNWLWGKIPAAALICALAVIVGLVWIVRKLRRADDLQTTVLAILVGLVVTVSPAALLLLSR